MSFRQWQNQMLRWRGEREGDEKEEEEKEGGGGEEGSLAVLPHALCIGRRSLLWATCLLHTPGTVHILNAERKKRRAWRYF